MIVSDFPALILSVASSLAKTTASRSVQISTVLEGDAFTVHRVPSSGSVVVPALSAVVFTKKVLPAAGPLISGEGSLALRITSPCRPSAFTLMGRAATTLSEDRLLTPMRPGENWTESAWARADADGCAVTK